MALGFLVAAAFFLAGVRGIAVEDYANTIEPQKISGRRFAPITVANGTALQKQNSKDLVVRAAGNGFGVQRRRLQGLLWIFCPIITIIQFTTPFIVAALKSIPWEEALVFFDFSPGDAREFAGYIREIIYLIGQFVIAVAAALNLDPYGLVMAVKGIIRSSSRVIRMIQKSNKKRRPLAKVITGSARLSINLFGRIGSTRGMCKHKNCLAGGWKYKGKVQGECSIAGSDAITLAWCATEVDENGEYKTGKYEWCDACVYCPDEKCVKKWSYKNAEQPTCSSIESEGKPWCPTKVDSDGRYHKGSNKFAYCTPCELSEHATIGETLEVMKDVGEDDDIHLIANEIVLSDSELGLHEFVVPLMRFFNTAMKNGYLWQYRPEIRTLKMTIDSVASKKHSELYDKDAKLLADQLQGMIDLTGGNDTRVTKTLRGERKRECLTDRDCEDPAMPMCLRQPGFCVREVQCTEDGELGTLCWKCSGHAGALCKQKGLYGVCTADLCIAACETFTEENSCPADRCEWRRVGTWLSRVVSSKPKFCVQKRCTGDHDCLYNAKPTCEPVSGNCIETPATKCDEKEGKIGTKCRICKGHAGNLCKQENGVGVCTHGMCIATCDSFTPKDCPADRCSVHQLGSWTDKNIYFWKGKMHVCVQGIIECTEGTELGTICSKCSGFAGSQCKMKESFGTCMDTKCMGLLQPGESCWTKCDNRAGPCEWCGSGKCCRQNFRGDGCSREEGGVERFECVFAACETFRHEANCPTDRCEWRRVGVWMNRKFGFWKPSFCLPKMIECIEDGELGTTCSKCTGFHDSECTLSEEVGLCRGALCVADASLYKKDPEDDDEDEEEEEILLDDEKNTTMSAKRNRTIADAIRDAQEPDEAHAEELPGDFKETGGGGEAGILLLVSCCIIIACSMFCFLHTKAKKNQTTDELDKLAGDIHSNREEHFRSVALKSMRSVHSSTSRRRTRRKHSSKGTHSRRSESNRKAAKKATPHIE